MAQSKNYLPISSLKEADREWTIKVKVLRKGTIDKYNSKKGSGVYQKYLLQDNEGVVIQGTSFNENVGKLKDQVQRGLTYYVSNGFIKTINKTYANAHHSLEIMFGPTTCVELADPLEDSIYSYKFIEFENLQDHMGQSSTIDVIGFVVDVQPLICINALNTDDKLYKKDVTLSNLRSKNIVFTLWGDLAAEEGETLATLGSTKPIIAISKAKVVDKNGSISISSLVITTIEIEPKILDSDNMMEWRASRDTDYQLSTSDYIAINLDTPYEELKLNDLISRDFAAFKDSYYCFKGEIVSVTNANAPLYIACNNCSKKVEKESTKCTNCNIKHAKNTERYMLKLTVQDDTKKASITLFEVAEKIIGWPPSEFATKVDQECITNLTGRTFIFTVRVQKATDTLRKAGRFVAHDVQPTD